MKKKTILNLILLVAIISIVIAILYFIVKDYEKEIEEQAKLPDTEEYVRTERKTLDSVNEKTNYFIAENAMKTLMRYIEYTKGEGSFGVTDVEELKEGGRESIYTILDPEYIEFSGITEEETGNIIKDYDEYKLIIDNIYYVQISSDIYVYLIDTKIGGDKYEFLLKVDNSNRTFSVFLEDYITEKGYKKGTAQDEISISKDNIDKNNENTYNVSSNITDEYISQRYLMDLKDRLIYDIENVYGMLEQEYKEKRFPTYEVFNEYVQNSMSKINEMKLVSYGKSIKDDGTIEYTCEDNFGNYYVFIADSILSYQVKMDGYTVDLEENLEEYLNVMSDKERAAYNIQKAIMSVNNFDYEYMYNKLDPNFKNDKIGTLVEFEEYMKENFYETNIITSATHEMQGDVHIYNLTITNQDKTEEMKIRFFIMLLDDMEYVLSFEVE